MSLIQKTMFTLALGLAACSSTETTPPSDKRMDAPEDTADFELSFSSDKLPVLQGATASIDVTLTRKNGFAGLVTVSALALPSGATMAPITFDAATTKATLTMTADAAAPHSLPTAVTVTAKADRQEVSKPLTVTVYGPPGSVDTSFAGGKVVMSIGASDDYAYGLAVQPDGKILVAGRVSDGLGDFALVRLERDGTPDTTFGTGGKVTTSIGAGSETAHAIAVQPDGKIVLAGTSASPTTGQDFALVRYLSDGKLDESFGDKGKVTTSFTEDTDIAHAILIEPDGRIIVGGEANNGSSSSGIDFALARYEANGKLDETFGQHGKVTTSISSNGGHDAAYALAIQVVDGERCIVAAGGEGDFALARYTAKGEVDGRFGQQGKVSGVWGTPMGAARALGVAPDGKLVVAGHSMHDFAVVKLSAGGELDQDFGDKGKVLTKVSTTNDDEAQSLAIEADGKLVVGGWVYEENSTSGNFALVRYDAKGALDTTFGSTGIVITEVAASKKSDIASAVLLQSDERVPTTRVLLAGYAATSNYDFAVARYWR
jgi:uncharacterized delta-60 repeat protein